MVWLKSDWWPSVGVRERAIAMNRVSLPRFLHGEWTVNERAWLNFFGEMWNLNQPWWRICESCGPCKKMWDKIERRRANLMLFVKVVFHRSVGFWLVNVRCQCSERQKGILSKKDSRLINSPKEEENENDRWPSCNLFVLIPAYKKSKLNERKILVVRSLFYSSLEFCTMIERWHVTEISTSDFTHHSVHSSCVHSLDHAGKDTLMGLNFLFLAGNFDDIKISVTRHNHFKGAPFPFCTVLTITFAHVNIFWRKLHH